MNVKRPYLRNTTKHGMNATTSYVAAEASRTMADHVTAPAHACYSLTLGWRVVLTLRDAELCLGRPDYGLEAEGFIDYCKVLALDGCTEETFFKLLI